MVFSLTRRACVGHNVLEQWSILAHIRYMVDLYHLTIHLCQHHCLGCYVQETPELCLQLALCRALDANRFEG